MRGVEDMDMLLLRIKALSDQNRLEILRLLMQKHYCVRALSRRLEISEAAVSQHIKVLREAGLIRVERRSYYHHYQVDTEVLHKIAQGIDQLTEGTAHEYCRS